MTDQCFGGPSKPKANAPSVLNVDLATIAQTITRYIPFMSVPSSAIGVWQQNLPTFCAGDPPAMPVWTAADMLAFLAGPAVSEWSGTQQKIRDLVNHVLWPQYCDCVDPGVTPPTPEVPVLPDGQGFAGGVVRTGCYNAGWAGVPPNYHSPIDTAIGLDVTTRLAPVLTGPPKQIDAGGHLYWAYPVTPNLTSFRYVLKTATSSFTLDKFNPIFDFQFFNSVDSRYHLFSFFQNNTSDPTDGIHMLPSPPVSMSIYAYYLTDNLQQADVDWSTSLNLDWYCGTGSPNNGQDCCPPDAGLMLMLSNIWQVVEDIQAKLNVPGTYVDGARHANLSGTGSLVLGAKTVAIRVETHPPIPTTIEVPGTPIYYYDMGFVTPYILGSPLRGTRITFNPHTVTLPTYTDQLGYTLRGGVLVDIVELQRGPASP